MKATVLAILAVSCTFLPQRCAANNAPDVHAAVAVPAPAIAPPPALASLPALEASMPQDTIPRHAPSPRLYAEVTAVLAAEGPTIPSPHPILFLKQPSTRLTLLKNHPRPKPRHPRMISRWNGH